jgi:hypothetical protein
LETDRRGLHTEAVDVDVVTPLHVVLLRAILARGAGHLGRPVATSFAVTGARLAELILAGHIADSGGSMRVTRRVSALDDCLWEQLFWRTGLAPAEVLRSAIHALVADGTWTIDGRRWRKIENRRYRDATPPELTLAGSPFSGPPAAGTERAVLDTLRLIEMPQMLRPVWFDCTPQRLVSHLVDLDASIRDTLTAMTLAVDDADKTSRSSRSIKMVPFAGG